MQEIEAKLAEAEKSLELSGAIPSHEGGEEVPYQEGRLDAMQRAEDLVSAAEPALVDGTVMFCGTFPAHGGIRPAERFRYELEDPVLERSLSGGYRSRDLPMVS